MEITQELIQRYHRNECTAAEREAVEAWLLESDAETAFPDGVDMESLRETSWEELHQRVAFKAQTKETKPFFQRWVLRGVAAGIVLALGLAYFLRPSAPAEVQYRVVEVPAGKKMEITLPDGSRVHLNSGSFIRYPERFTDSLRLVSFGGEAYFDIAHDTTKSFVINGPRSVVRVLGTAFNFRAYEDETMASVNVVRGKVQLSDPGSGEFVILTAGETGWQDAERQLSKTVQDISSQLAWQRGGLIFDNQPLKEVFRTIERWYGITVEVQDKALLAQRYTGEFNNPPFGELVKSLSFAYGFEYRFENKVLTINNEKP
ncbi:FecR family protein [Parapedobacter koreensis]|uniref:FecR family protein n=1 Tax=Parapedobacter koreensis TaxID=332977 RepID=A0A1H7JYI8_9SPHI|nr:FecR domain-containing protein [Parapedobacter koreensis]SEK78685.1 FecR family protein [Parapedobacter koreensis]